MAKKIDRKFSRVFISAAIAFGFAVALGWSAWRLSQLESSNAADPDHRTDDASPGETFSGVERRSEPAGKLPNSAATSRSDATSPQSEVSNVWQASLFPVKDIFEVQLALDRQAISPGTLDGAMGPKTRHALRAFQQKEGLPITGELDPNTQARLFLAPPVLVFHLVTAADLACIQPLGSGWLEKSQQSRLDFESILEMVAEKSHSHPALIRRLNPAVEWQGMLVGTRIQIPYVEYSEPRTKAVLVRIELGHKLLQAFDGSANLLCQFPCSIAQRSEKRILGRLQVAALASNPNYTFDPAVFPELPEAREIGRKLIIPPGPNNPVGVAWIGLNRPGYGIHGTPRPEEIGQSESHGCFRLANWAAEYLLRLVSLGTPVLIEP